MLFKYRRQARAYAKKMGMKVIDHKDYSDTRWEVVPKDFKLPVVELDEKIEVLASRFFKSRTEARAFAKKTPNCTVYDHAKNRDEKVVKDLGRTGQRWECLYPDEVSDALEAGPEDQAIYKKIANGYRRDQLAVFSAENPFEEREPVVIMTPGNLAITTVEGETHNISRADDIFQEVVDFLRDGDFVAAIALIKQGIKAKEVLDLGDNLKVLDGNLYWYGIKQDCNIGNRILNDLKNGTFDERYARFMGKLMQNPSYKSVEMLYDFLQANNMNILPDGNFEAFKGVQLTDDGWRDYYTGLVPNYAGMTVAMPRNMVEDDPTKSCSQGLHIGSLEYASNYGNVMTVSVNPADMVSVPYNYQNRKARCCRYTVLVAPESVPEGQAPSIVVGTMGALLEEIWVE